MKRLSDCRLYTFVDAGYLAGRDPVDLAMRLCDGGSDILQLRAKDWSEDQVRRTAESLLPICEMNDVLLVVNDHYQVAARIGAPMAHLGQEDFFDAGWTRVSDLPLDAIPDATRQSGTLLGDQPRGALRIGLSSHEPSQAERAVASGAAYVAIGPVFPTPTKPGRPGVTLDYVRWATANLQGVPWFAIGGINLENLDQVLGAGARRIAVVSAILNAPDVTRACREFRSRLSG